MAGHDHQVHDQRGRASRPGNTAMLGTPDGADVRGDPARVHATASTGSGWLACRAQRTPCRQGVAAAARQPHAELDGRRAVARGGDVAFRAWPSGSPNWLAKPRCGISPIGACSSRSRCCETVRKTSRRSPRAWGMSPKRPSTGRSSAPRALLQRRGAEEPRAYPQWQGEVRGPGKRCATSDRWLNAFPDTTPLSRAEL